jgi:hypothetical protein
MAYVDSAARGAAMSRAGRRWSSPSANGRRGLRPPVRRSRSAGAMCDFAEDDDTSQQRRHAREYAATQTVARG